MIIIVLRFVRNQSKLMCQWFLNDDLCHPEAKSYNNSQIFSSFYFYVMHITSELK